MTDHLTKLLLQSFRHVSFLQVLHKTNAPIFNEVNLENISYKKEDPINLLTKGKLQ